MNLIAQSAFREVITNSRFNLLILTYILVNTGKNFSTIHFQLNYIDVLEVVIL